MKEKQALEVTPSPHAAEAKAFVEQIRILRAAIAFALAYQAALTEGKAFVRAMPHTLRVAKAMAGGHALNIYALAQRLAKEENGAELVPHVENMRRKLKIGRRKATSEPAPGQFVTTAPKQ